MSLGWRWAFKKLRRQLQRKRNIKIELCVKLSVLRLFRVDDVVRNSALSLAWHEWFWCKGKERNLLLQARVVIRTSNMKISRRRLADYVKTLHQKACRTCSTIIFLISTNQIIDLWSCRSRVVVSLSVVIAISWLLSTVIWKLLYQSIVS